MSNFFRFFPVVDYKFGNNGSTDKIENIAIYANIVDQVINNVTTYTEYNILPEDRPDTVSQKLYGTPNFHWTFYLANDDIRSSGWPLSPRQLFNQIVELYPTRVITTRTKLTDKFKAISAKSLNPLVVFVKSHLPDKSATAMISATCAFAVLNSRINSTIVVIFKKSSFKEEKVSSNSSSGGIENKDNANSKCLNNRLVR